MTDRQGYFITVMAADRPGIVGHIGRRVQALEGSILELSQTVIQGHFTVILHAVFAAGTAAATVEHELADSLPGLAVRVMSAGGEPAATPVGQRLMLTARGPDQPGLVAAIGTFLAGRDINIEDMYCRSSAEDEQFVMILQVRCPPGRELRQLQLDLAELADDLGMVAHLQHENVFLATTEVGAVRTLSL